MGKQTNEPPKNITPLANIMKRTLAVEEGISVARPRNPFLPKIKSGLCQTKTHLQGKFAVNQM